MRHLLWAAPLGGRKTVGKMFDFASIPFFKSSLLEMEQNYSNWLWFFGAKSEFPTHRVLNLLGFFRNPRTFFLAKVLPWGGGILAFASYGIYYIPLSGSG